MTNIPYENSSGNIFADLGFTPAATAKLTVKSMLIVTIGDTIKARGLTQQEAARLCSTDQPTLSKVLRGRMESVTIDKLAAWLNELGRTVKIRVHPYDRAAETGQLVMARRLQGGPFPLGGARHPQARRLAVAQSRAEAVPLGMGWDGPRPQIRTYIDRC